MKSFILFTARMAALTVVLMVLSGVGSGFLPESNVAAEAVTAEGAGHPAQVLSLPTVLAIMLLQVLALAWPILQSRWRGWRLALAIFLVHFGTVTFMSQIESLVYLGGKMPGDLISGLFAMGLFIAAVFAPIAVLVLGKWKPAAGPGAARAPALRLGRWGWRVAAAGLVFLCLYYLFGYYVAWQDPELRAYYGGTDPGSFVAQMRVVMQDTPWMIPLQFIRGLMWVALGMIIIRSMRGPWWHSGLATALLFAVPSLYLLFPNPLMPDFPRITHLVETLPYQFLFGLFLAWFFARGAAEAGG